MKKKKLTKTEKEKIAGVVKRWNPSFINRHIHKFKSPTDFVIAGVLLTDIMAAGGAISVIFLPMAGYFGFEGARSFRKSFIGGSWENNSTQKVKSSDHVKYCLRGMEIRAKTLFNQVSKDGRKEYRLEDNRIIKELALIQDDIDTIKPLYLVKNNQLNEFIIYLDDMNNLSQIAKNKNVTRKKLDGGFGT